MTKPQLDAGASRLLAGRYQLLEELASGGMASVWRGHDQVLGRDVAIKLLREDLAADGKFAARFRQEAVHAANLNHPGIVGVFDIGAHDGVPYIVMELVDGRTIHQLLAREGPLPPGQAARIALGVAQALAYAHRLGVTHRNLKPANILLTQSGSVKVADFALARAVEGEDPDRTGEILGPPTGYVAPEQLAGGQADDRADLYALGVCLFEMLTGAAPWDANRSDANRSGDPSGDPAGAGAPTPRSLRPEVPAELDEIVRKAMASDPADRFPGARELVAALRDQTGRPAPQPVPPPPPAERRTTAPLPPPEDHTTAPRHRPVPAAGTAARLAQQPTVRAPLRPRGSRTPSRTGWLGPIAAVVIVLAAIATLVATGSLRPNPDAATGDTRGTTTTAKQARLETSVVGSIDPVQGGGESPLREDRAADDDPSTSWATETYKRAPFGGYKAGLGLIVEARGATAPRRLELVTNSGGSVRIYAAEQPFGNREPLDPVAPASALDAQLREIGWREIAGPTPLDGTTTFELPEGTPKFLLIWVTKLPQVGPQAWRLEIFEARLRS